MAKESTSSYPEGVQAEAPCQCSIWLAGRRQPQTPCQHLLLDHRMMLEIMGRLRQVRFLEQQ